MRQLALRFIIFLLFTSVCYAQVAQVGHVFIVVEENNNYSSVIGSASMPYLNSLANQYGLATQYYADTHPSIGNYFMLTAGQVITNNDKYVPPSGGLDVDNIVRHLLSAGKTWKSYEEDLPSVGYIGASSGLYRRKHCPLSFFSDVMGSSVQVQNLVPFTQFAADLANNQLPNFSFITPNECNDAHDCPLSTADTWLKANIAPLIASPVFQQDGLLVIVFDEAGSDNTNGGGRIAWVAVSPKVKSAYQSTTLYQHQSTLRMISEALGLTSFPGAAASAGDMAEFFGSTSPPPTVVTISPTSPTISSGATQQFSASVTGNTNKSVNWSASTGTVSTSGLYAAPKVTVTTTATVTATSAADATKFATASITITPPATTNLPPSCSLSLSANSGQVPLTISATATCTDPENDISTTVLNWGDGTVQNLASGTHTYNNPGAYTVRVTATDKGNLSGTSTQAVTAQSTPSGPSFTLSVTAGSQVPADGPVSQY